MSFTNLSSPYQQIKRSTSQIMFIVILCLVPAIMLQSYFFGIGNLLQIILSVFTALVAEAAVLKLRNRPIINTLKDGSAILTAVLIAVSIPSLAPWWLVIIGALFAIIFVKQLFGGLGQNIFNPAMAAYVLLLISFPVPMTTWNPTNSLLPFPVDFIDQIKLVFTGVTTAGHTLDQLAINLDGLTLATPLNTVQNGLHAGYTLTEIAKSSRGINNSEFPISVINIAYLFGGCILLFKRLIHWHIPVAFLTSITLFSFISFVYDPEHISSPFFQLFTGATMIGAFFILSDPVTASTTPKGRFLYAILIAFFVVLIRNAGGYPDALAFAVLIGNMCVPLIDYYTKPPVYGSL
ncbi:MAG: electron transport complex subunit RsxD [Psychromonas sp.]|nr:electron transport complex subunit RsxD [Psychromonas sp.]